MTFRAKQVYSCPPQCGFEEHELFGPVCLKKSQIVPIYLRVLKMVFVVMTRKKKSVSPMKKDVLVLRVVTKRVFVGLMLKKSSVLPM